MSTVCSQLRSVIGADGGGVIGGGGFIGVGCYWWFYWCSMLLVLGVIGDGGVLLVLGVIGDGGFTGVGCYWWRWWCYWC